MQHIMMSLLYALSLLPLRATSDGPGFLKKAFFEQRIKASFPDAEKVSFKLCLPSRGLFIGGDWPELQSDGRLKLTNVIIAQFTEESKRSTQDRPTLIKTAHALLTFDRPLVYEFDVLRCKITSAALDAGVRIEWTE